MVYLVSSWIRMKVDFSIILHNDTLDIGCTLKMARIFPLASITCPDYTEGINIQGEWMGLPLPAHFQGSE